MGLFISHGTLNFFADVIFCVSYGAPHASREKPQEKNSAPLPTLECVTYTGTQQEKRTRNPVIHFVIITTKTIEDSDFNALLQE